MRLSPDELVFWQYGFIKLNATIVFTWVLMLVLAVSSKIITRKLSTGLERSRWQNLLEIIVTGILDQIEDVGLSEPRKYIGFLGTLFLFIAMATLFTHHSRLRAANRIALNNCSARVMCVCRSADIRHRGARIRRLPQIIHGADIDHAAV